MSVGLVEMWSYPVRANQCRDLEITIGRIIHQVNPSSDIHVPVKCIIGKYPDNECLCYNNTYKTCPEPLFEASHLYVYVEVFPFFHRIHFRLVT